MANDYLSDRFAILRGDKVPPSPERDLLYRLKQLRGRSSNKLFKQYRGNQKRCPTCGAMPIIIRDDDGREIPLSPPYQYPDSTYRYMGEDHPCNCREQLALRYRYLVANIPTEYWSLGRREYFGDENAWDLAEDYVERWPDLKRHGMGRTISSEELGTGKTLLAAWIAKELIKGRDRPHYRPSEYVFFKSFRKLIEDRVHEWPLEERRELENNLMRMPVLILDEVGPGKLSDRQSDYFASKLEDVIRARVDSQFPTIITTNMTPESLDDEYERVFSLLEARNPYIEVTGEDVRRSGDILRRSEWLMQNNEVRPIV